MSDEEKIALGLLTGLSSLDAVIVHLEALYWEISQSSASQKTRNTHVGTPVAQSINSVQLSLQLISVDISVIIDRSYVVCHLWYLFKC